VVNGRNFPDALAVSSYAAKMKYPILLTDAENLPAASTKALKEIDSVIVAGGENAVSENVFKKLKNAERVAGKDRYAT
ncbi:cell wall-binding repeat-containing protein, partial [Mycobacterium tuberculosis]|nr:cell wall-binding repeat-containing protein [Mycobacterium tuberculosis]